MIWVLKGCLVGIVTSILCVSLIKIYEIKILRGGKMKIKCLLRHPLRLMKTNECIKESFEGEYRIGDIYWCKKCGKVVYVKTKCVKPILKEEYRNK